MLLNPDELIDKIKFRPNDQEVRALVAKALRSLSQEERMSMLYEIGQIQ